MNSIILLFGGDSCERDISIITAVQLYENIDKDKYIVHPIYMFDGQMYRVHNMSIDTFIDYKPKKRDIVFLANHCVYNKNCVGTYSGIHIDVAILANHGGNGENGELAGYLDIAHIPYTASPVLASSVLMDKAVTKRILRGLGISTLPHISVSSMDNDYVNIVKRLKMPIIVKPARLGSSIGVRIVNDIDNLSNAIELALYYDKKVILEHALSEFEEYNVALYRHNGEIIFSNIESPNLDGKMLDFDAKYGANGKLDGIAHGDDILLKDDVIEKIYNYAKKIYTELDVRGVVRIDYFVVGDKVYVNEVNTIPGSLAYYLFESKGINYRQLIDDMIDEALLDAERDNELIRYYKSSVLKNAKNAGNKLRK